MSKLKSLLEKSESYARNVICFLMTIIMGFLFIESFMHTMELRKSEESFEGIHYHSDNFIVNAICIFAVLLLFAVLVRYLEKIPIAIQMGGLAAITITLGVIWVMSSQSAPREDAMVVTRAASGATKNDFSFMSERYFSNYHYQLGFVFFSEIIMRIFHRGDENMLYFQIINVVLLAAAYMGIILMLRKTFESKRIQTIAVVTLLFCVQPILYSVFTYGVIPGITFSIYAVLFEILYFQSEKKTKYIWAILSVLCIGIAVMIKSNNYIVFAAMAILAVVKLIRRRKLADLLYIVVAALITINVNSAVCKMYEARSNVKLEGAVPMISFAVMGLNYPNNVVGCTAAGWYNGGYTAGNHEEHNFITKDSAKASMKQIEERVSYFAHNYQEANDFFYEKNMSQWNEPTYSCIWLNIAGWRYKDAGKIANYICEDGMKKAMEYMNIYQMIVFLGAFVGVICCFKKKNILCCALILIVLGGFLYHMIFEGKSQYILPYFILLCGFSAVGMDYLCNQITERIKNRKKGVKQIGTLKG